MAGPVQNAAVYKVNDELPLNWRLIVESTEGAGGDRAPLIWRSGSPNKTKPPQPRPRFKKSLGLQISFYVSYCKKMNVSPV